MIGPPAPALSATIALPFSSTAPRAARTLVAALLTVWDTAGTWAGSDLAGDAVLLCSEVVTNAVEHATGDTESAAMRRAVRAALRLDVVLTAEHLHIAVTDGSTVAPVVCEPDEHRLRGRGMWLVAQIADRWGTDPDHDGKSVWFDLALPGISTHPAPASRRARPV